METNKTIRLVKTPETVQSNVIVDESVYEIWKSDRCNPVLAEMNEDDKKTLILCRSVLSLLNKLTPENYSTLLKKLKNFSIDTSIRMQQVVEIIHRKAVRDWKYRAIYAKVCDEIRDIQVVNELGIEKTFSLYLVGQCEMCFVNSLCQDFRLDREKIKIIKCFDQENKMSSLKDFEQTEYEFRKDSVGNCQFIGELFKVFFIHPQIIFITLDRLFKATGDVAIECICVILNTIGSFYEEKIGKLPAEYFSKLKPLMSNDKLSLRTRFIIQDLFELKKNYWHPRHLPELPKPIRQLDQEIVLYESMFHLVSVQKKKKTKEIKLHSEWTDISITYFEHLCESSSSKQQEKTNPILNPTGKAHTFEDAVCNILEKLTVDNFNQFAKAMKKLPINDGLRLQLIADLIFQYAVNKPNKCKLYAELCRNLQNLRVPDRKHIPPDPTLLKTIVVNKIQQDFDTNRTLKVVESESESHRKFVSNCRFIAELFNVEVLHIVIMLRCIEKLMESKNEESLKCLYELLTVAGKNLLSKLRQLNLKKEENELLEKLENLLEDEKCCLSSEMKSVLKDLSNMKRKNESVTCNGANVNTPTIGEPVHIQLAFENNAPKLSSKCSEKKQIEKETLTKLTLASEFEDEITRILDNLSCNNFTPSVESIKKFPICNAGQLHFLVNTIHRKATSEPDKCSLYTKLCCALQNLNVIDETCKPTITFKILLLNKCQQQFECNKAKELKVAEKQKEIDTCTDPKTKQKLQSAFNESECEFHRKQIGNCRIIAELFKQKLITTKIMVRCTAKLESTVNDLSLECLCTLLTIVGEDVGYDPRPMLKDLDSRVEKIQIILDSEKNIVSPSVESMFQEIANNWGSYKRFKNDLSLLKPEDFDSFVDVINNLLIESVSRLRDIVDFIFNLALDRVGLHKLYAKVCGVLLYRTVFDNKRGEILTFKMLLKEKCQKQSEQIEIEKSDDMMKQKENNFDPTEQRTRRECFHKSMKYRRFLAELCELIPDFGKNIKLKECAPNVTEKLGRSKGEIEITPSVVPKKSKEISPVPCVKSEAFEILEAVLEKWKPNEKLPDQLESIKCAPSSKELPEAISKQIKHILGTDASKAEKCGKFFVHLINHNYLQSETIIAGLSCFLRNVENQLAISSNLDFIMKPLFESGYLKLDDLNTIFGHNSNTKPIEDRETVSLKESPPRKQMENISSSPHPKLQCVQVKSSITNNISSSSNSIIHDLKVDVLTPDKLQQLIRDTLIKHSHSAFNRTEFKRDVEKIPFQTSDELKYLAQCIIQMVLDKPDLCIFYAKLCHPIIMLNVEKKRFWMQLMLVCNRYFQKVYFNEDGSSSNRKKPDLLVICKEEITEKNTKGFCRFFASVVNGMNNETANVTCRRIMRKLIEVRQIEVFCEIYDYLKWSNDRFEKSLFESCIPALLSGQKLETEIRERLQWTVEDYTNKEMIYQREVQTKAVKQSKNQSKNIPGLARADTEGDAERRQSSSSSDKSEDNKQKKNDAVQIVQKSEVSEKLEDSPALSNKQIVDTVEEALNELQSHPDKVDLLALRLCSMRINNESKLTQIARTICRTAMTNNSKAKFFVELCERMRSWNIIDVKNGNVVWFSKRLLCYLREYRVSPKIQMEIKTYKDRVESDDKNSINIPEKIISYCRLLCEFLKSPVFCIEFFINDVIELLLLDPINEDAVEMLSVCLNILRKDLRLKLMNDKEQLSMIQKYNVILDIIILLQEIINFQKRGLELTDIRKYTNKNSNFAQGTNQVVENRSVVYNRRLNVHLEMNPDVIGKTIKHFEELCRNPARFINSIVVSMCRCFLREWQKGETGRNIDKEFSSYALLFKIFSQNMPSFEYHCTNALFDLVKNSHFPPGMMSKMLEALYLYEIMPPESLLRLKNLFVSEKISELFGILDSLTFQKYKLSQNSNG